MPILIPYLAAAGAHLLFCLFWPGGKGRAVTKGLLMPCLLLFALLGAARSGPSWLLCAAILLGWAGDLLLLVPERKGFFLGGAAAFLGGHICYAILLFRLLAEAPTPLWLLLTAAGSLLGVGGAAYLSLRKGLGGMKLPMMAYLISILIMALGAVLLAAQAGLQGRFLPAHGWIAVGGGCFLLSDYLLAWGLFLRKPALGDFWVMLTYISAQLLLVMGLVYLGA